MMRKNYSLSYTTEKSLEELKTNILEIAQSFILTAQKDITETICEYQLEPPAVL